MNDSLSAGKTAPVTVVIVNFNGGEHLPRCLECLARQTSLPERIVVVDNASSDESLAAARTLVGETPALAGRTTFDAAGRNLGFAAASNRGLAMATTDFVALLNP
ncbi:MAG: glycosyltransferase family 2 protein, partial [Planctomycetota bacterium]